jgi:hypothetical protein
MVGSVMPRHHLQLQQRASAVTASFQSCATDMQPEHLLLDIFGDMLHALFGSTLRWRHAVYSCWEELSDFM